MQFGQIDPQWRTRLRRLSRRVIGTGTRRKVILGLFGFEVISTLILAFAFDRIASEVDPLLAGGSPGCTVVGFRPLRLARGDWVSISGVRASLARAGYAEADTSASNWFALDEDRIEGCHTRGGNRSAFTVRFRQGARPATLDRVVSVLLDGDPADTIAFLPATAGVLRDGERRLRIDVSFDQLPDHLVDAILTSEDRGFFEHPGFSARGVARAVWVNLRQGRLVQGGSTITQQLVKNLLGEEERTFGRKIREVIYAVVLEARASKRDIFEAYVNAAYLGRAGACGIEGIGAGARVFLDKHVRDLTPAESALLAGIIPSPNRLSPIRHPDAARRSRDAVLDAMLANGVLDSARHETARATPIDVFDRDVTPDGFPAHFLDYVAAKIEDEKGLPPERIVTTLDATLQEAAGRAVRVGMARLDRRLNLEEDAADRPEAALIALDPESGRILAMVGGRDYGRSPFNRATQAWRQPGSVFKPFVYAAAIESGVRGESDLTLATRVVDEPYQVTFNKVGYAPANYADKYVGDVTLREALALSLNASTLKVAEHVGYKAVSTLGHAVGLGRRLYAYPSASLGAFETTLLDLAAAYRPFANGGRYGEPVWRGTDRSDDTRALSVEAAFLATSAMQTAIDVGTGRGARESGFGRAAAGKTGTSRDSWFVGFTPDLLCAVWVGYDEGRELGLTGAQAALPIWTDFMRQADAAGLLSGRDFQEPPSVVRTRICSGGKRRASESCRKAYEEYFATGTEPVQVCQHGRSFWGWFQKIF